MSFAPPLPADFPDPLAMLGFPAGCVDAFQAACAVPSEDLDQLRDAIDKHVQAYMRLHERDHRLAPDEMLALARAWRQLIVRSEVCAVRERRLALAAVRYFVLRDDAEMDFEIGGFDDDIAVTNAVAAHLGFDDCRVTRAATAAGGADV